MGGGFDVAVVGGGIAGVSVAYELAADRSVLLVEAERSLASHTTGRSAAAYLPSYGGPVVRALTAASLARFAELESTLDTPPLLTPRPLLWIGCDETGENAVGALTETTAARPVTPKEALDRCPVLDERVLRAVAIDGSAMDIDPMGLHQGYVRGLRARGGRIESGAPVSRLRRDGTRWSLAVGAQRFSADIVVNAAGAWVDHLAALAGVAPLGVRPLRRTIAIASGPVPVARDLPLVADGAERFYFRPEGAGLLISPADETPSEPTDAKPDELDVALALERVNEVTTLGLRTVHTAWAGLRTFAADRRPVVGARAAEPGFVFFAGQGGYGIQMAPALAAFAAAVVLRQPPPDDIALRPDDLSPGMS